MFGRRSKNAAACVGQDQVVFDPDAQFIGDIDPWFDRDHAPDFKALTAARSHARPFMDPKTDPVAEGVGEEAAETLPGKPGTGHEIEVAGEHSWSGTRKRLFLGREHGLIDSARLPRGVSNRHGSRQISAVSRHRAPEIQRHKIPPTHLPA